MSMFINEEIHWSDMSPEFQSAEMRHEEALPASFDDALYFDIVMLFFGL